MLKEINKLGPEDASIVLQAPALLSVMAACSEKGTNIAEKVDAIRMSHLRTFTAEFQLLDYYREVEKTFVEQFELLANKYYPMDDENKEAITRELRRLNRAISKLGARNEAIMHKSLDSYVAHVKKAGRSVFFDFFFPVPIKGITD
jgi:hypothetical protein